MEKKILFVGAGSMAEAMIAGIVESGLIAKKDIFVTNKQNKERLDFIHETYGVQTSYNQEYLFQEADVVILAMKPKDVASSLQSLRPYAKSTQLFVSVIAGVETTTIATHLNMNAPIIRVMPNTSAAVGYSMTALAAGEYATEADLALTEKILQTIGVTKVVEEAELDIVTAISGSGPAYIYYFVEAIKKAAKEFGLPEDQADELFTHTIIGAGKMLEQSQESPEKLRENISSEGGTTAEGIKALQAGGFEQAIYSCVEAAKTRSEELAARYR